MEFKGITWAGNLYQKFEAMCLEVEEVMVQDTVKFIEDQAQTVGANFKKFYSDVMEDFRPLSCIDPTIGTADSPLNPHAHTEITKKPRQSIGGELKEVKTKRVEDCATLAEPEGADAFNWDFDLTENAELSARKRKSCGLYRRPVVVRRGSRNHACASKMSGSDTPVSCNTSSISSLSEIKNAALSTSDEAYHSIQAKDGNRHTDEEVCTSRSLCDTPVPATTLSHETVTKKQVTLGSASPELPSESIASHPQNEIASGMEPMIDTITSALAGRSDNPGTNVITTVSDAELEIVERLGESKFEESCFLVERDDIGEVPPKEGKPKSYKKKFREAFSSKRLTRKQEYEKLATQYSIEAQKLESTWNLKPVLLKDPNRKKVQAEHIPDTEWELL